MRCGYVDRLANALEVQSPPTAAYLDMLTDALEQLPVATIVVDMQAGNLPIRWVSSSFERLTGYASADCVGHNCRFLQACFAEDGGLCG